MSDFGLAQQVSLAVCSVIVYTNIACLLCTEYCIYIDNLSSEDAFSCSVYLFVDLLILLV